MGVEIPHEIEEEEFEIPQEIEEEEEEGLQAEEELTLVNAEEETTHFIQRKEGNNIQIVKLPPLNEPDTSQDIDSFEDDYFQELQELEFLEETLDQNLAADDDFEFQEKDFLLNFTEQSHFPHDDLSFLSKGKGFSETQLKETARYALSKTERLLAVEPDNISALEDWNDCSVDIAAIMRYHKPASRVIQVDAVPIDQPKVTIKQSHTSRSSSSDASSSDAESIILPEKPCFSFMTCDAINDDIEAGKKNTTTMPGGFVPRKGTNGDLSREATYKLVEACQPDGYFCQERSCFVLDEQHSPDDFYFDDTELIWGEKEDDFGTVTVLYLDERGQGIEKNIEKNTSEESLFPDLDRRLYDINPVLETLATELSIKLGDGSTDSFDSDQDLPPRSPAMDTPMKLFYHLVPSPHSSSNEDLDENQSAKHKAMTAKSLSPIQECPSRESSLNRSSGSLVLQELRDQNYNIIDASVQDNNHGITVEAIERDAYSPLAKYFRTVEHEQQREHIEHYEQKKTSPQKHELRSLLQRFVADQIVESQGAPGDIEISRPRPKTPVAMERVTWGNRRCRVISPSETPSQDILLPPLKPHRRSMSDRARVICSPKLGVQREREYGSDVVSYRMDYRDDSSDSSLTTRTEPWCPIRPRALFPTPKTNVPTNVTFLGSEEAPLPCSQTKVVPVDNDTEEPRGAEAGVDNGKEARNSKRNQESKRDQEFGYQSEPEVRRNRTSNRRNKQKREERGYVSEGEGKLTTKTRCDASSSFVRLTYCGSEISGSELEMRRPRLHQSEPHVGRYGNLKKPPIRRHPIDPETPYAPQSEFKVRQQRRRSLPKIIYRLSGEFAAVVTTADGTGSTTHYVQAVTQAADTRHGMSLNRRLGSTARWTAMGIALAKSTSTVWVLSEPTMSCEEMTTDEQSVPGTPVCSSRSRGLNKLRLFRYSVIKNIPILALLLSRLLVNGFRFESLFFFNTYFFVFLFQP